MTANSVTGSPSRTSTSPASRLRSVIWLAIHSMASRFSSAKRGNGNKSAAVNCWASGSGMAFPLSVPHVLVDKVGHHGAFAHAVGNPADRSVAHIADGKYTRHVGFEQVRVTVEIPARGPFPV